MVKHLPGMYKALDVTLQHCKEKIVLTENLIEITEKMLRNQCVMLLTRKEQAEEGSREMKPVTFPSLRMGATLIRVSTDHLGEQSSAEAFVVRYFRRPSAVWSWKRRAERVVDDGWGGRQRCAAELCVFCKTFSNLHLR